MKSINFHSFTKRTVLSAIAIMTVMTGVALADDINLSMEGNTATVPKGNTVTRRINGIPRIGGTLRLRFKWHAVNIIPNTFNPLKVVVKHGNTTLNTQNACYSTHSNREPKCDVNLTISQQEAERPGNWTLEITNNSAHEVISFDIQKGSDINPMVPSFRSIYRPNCPNTVNLDMEGVDATITKGGSVERRIFGIGNLPGTMVLKMKWHAVNIVPNTFNRLNIEVFDTRGNRVQSLSGSFFSLHSNQTPRYDRTFQITDANLGGNQPWKIKVTNNTAFEVISFNIEKGGDINPMVPSFRSTYKANCP